MFAKAALIPGRDPRDSSLTPQDRRATPAAGRNELDARTFYKKGAIDEHMLKLPLMEAAAARAGEAVTTTTRWGWEGAYRRSACVHYAHGLAVGRPPPHPRVAPHAQRRQRCSLEHSRLSAASAGLCEHANTGAKLKSMVEEKRSSLALAGGPGAYTTLRVNQHAVLADAALYESLFRRDRDPATARFLPSSFNRMLVHRLTPYVELANVAKHEPLCLQRPDWQ